MVRLLMIAFTSLLTTAVSAAEPEKIEAALAAWIKTSQARIESKQALVTGKIEGSRLPRLRTLKKNEFFQMVGLSTPNLADTRLFFLVNNFRPESAATAAAALKLDYSFEIFDGQVKVTDIATKKSISIPDQQDEDLMVAQLRKGFGYDGYVVDTRENLILARVVGGLLDIGRQAVVINSKEPFLSKQSKAGAASLIELIARKGDFGLFRILIGESGSGISSGSRVQFSSP